MDSGTGMRHKEGMALVTGRNKFWHWYSKNKIEKQMIQTKQKGGNRHECKRCDKKVCIGVRGIYPI